MLIGHIKQKKYFSSIVKNGALSHAYIFSGEDMIGKRTFAYDSFKTINGRDFAGDPDLISIAPNFSEGETKIYIDDIRKLKSFFRLKPYYGPYKVAIIDDAHRLTPEASNALLKLLEEPPSFSVIILVSSVSGMLPATIQSRCEKVGFLKPGEKEVIGYLADKKIKKEDKEFLVKLAGGRIGLINKIIEEKNLPEARKSVDDLRKLLSAPIYEKINYAKKVHDKEKYQPTIDYWLSWVSAHVRNSSKNEKIVKDLLFLHSIVSQPQYNHRLALENFLINL